MPTEDTSLPKPSGFLTLLWALFFFLLFALLVVIWMRRNGPSSLAVDKAAENRITQRETLQKADAEKLAAVEWGDKAKGVVHIPLSDAKRLVLGELKNKTLGVSAVKVEPRLPMPAPFDPNAAEPAPGALPSAPQGADTIYFQPPAPAAAPSASNASASMPVLFASLSTGPQVSFPWTATSEITQ
ncbi:MAG: hypothetical protein JWL90_1670 [Chthoniobacteraceae bacterium]|nr:hypothetical protein [Chthoniobacteraceae bacterium]MDB6171753.1 hypothetical protein [Chthoniobacteraceae bacterium]